MPFESLDFRITRYTDDGVYYVIEGIDIALVTDGDTLSAALDNLKEAIDLYFADEDHHDADAAPPSPDG